MSIGNEMNKLTRNEKNILTLLVTDANQTNTAISRQLSITSQAVAKIRKNLEKKGVIRNYSVDVDVSKLGISIFTIALLQLKSEELSELGNENPIFKDPNLVSAFRVTRSDISHVAVYAFSNIEELEAHFQGLKNTYGDFLFIKNIYPFSSKGFIKNDFKELIRKIVKEDKL